MTFVATSTLRLLNQSRLGTCIYCFVFFVITGCSSLHVDVSPSVDWSQVTVLKFQSPLSNPWQLTQPIKSELKGMGFQVEETHATPDLLFSYFTQEGPDLTDESEVLTRLKSLHVRFFDPATKTLVTSADYFYPEVTNPPTPDTGVKELFSGLRQKIQVGQPDESAKLSIQPVTAKPFVVAPPTQIQESSTELLKTEPEKDVVHNSNSSLGEIVSPGQETEPASPKTDKAESLQSGQKTDSPWLPRFKSWGFENWGQDSASDY